MKTTRSNDKLLYLKLKNIIYEKVFNGDYIDGSLIPTERELANTYSMSRITVRSTLELLEMEGFITRVQGRGTAIHLKKWATQTDMGIIAVVAPNIIPFFSRFLEIFSKVVENNDSLLLIKTQNENVNLNIEKYLFKLFTRNIRNVVLWLHDSNIDYEYIRRLRGMGMNFVFFDIIKDTQYGDAVLLDNTAAMKAVYSYVKERHLNKNIVYLSWDNMRISSIHERYKTFLHLTDNQSKVMYLPWEKRWEYKSQLFSLIQSNQKNLPNCFICVSDEIAIELKKILINLKRSNIEVATIDDQPEMKQLGITSYAQPINKMATQVFDCLVKQNSKENTWKPNIFLMKGKLIKAM